MCVCTYIYTFFVANGFGCSAIGLISILPRVLCLSDAVSCFRNPHIPCLHLDACAISTCCCVLRVEFLLKTESGYLKDAEVT